MWNGTGIVYNRSLQPPPARWADLWSPRLKGRLTMLDDPEDMLGACLKKLGISFSATAPSQLAHAEHEAIAQKPLLRAYLNAEVRDQLVAGDVLAAQLWSTTAQQAIDAAPAPRLRLSRRRAFPFYCDCAVILRESRRARPGAPVPGLPAAPRRLGQDRRGHPHRHRQRRGASSCCPTRSATRPASIRPARSSSAGEWPRTLDSATQRLRDRIWTEIKSA